MKEAFSDQPIDPAAPPREHRFPRASHPDEESVERLERIWADPKGISFIFKAIQNDAIGGRIMITAFFFFLVGGVLALLMRLQLIRPENGFLSPESYNQAFTMHGSTMMYLFAVPMIEGMAMVMMPLMLGNREMPFPRLGVFSFFTFILGGILFYMSYLFNAVPDTGWFAYVPLSGPEMSPGIALDFWLLALGVAEVAAIAAGVEIILSILLLRAPGLSLDKLPLYAWAMLVTAFAILFAFTPLIVGSLFLELDRKIGTQFYNPAMGGSPILWQHLFWIFGHPEVYIQFIPATGMLAMIVPVFSRRRIVGYPFIVAALVGTGVLSFGLWVHHMFTVGLPTATLAVFAAASIVIAIPSGVQVFAYIATIGTGKPRCNTPMLFAMGFLIVFVLGGITGVMVASIPFDWQAHDSYFVVAHLHYVLIGGMLFPFFAAFFYWMPKFSGKLLNEGLGKVQFWLMFVGVNVTFFPQHIVGLQGMPRRVYTYPAGFGWDIYNLISTLGAFLIAAGVALFIYNFATHFKRGDIAGANPWGADSLEWSVSSPPYNFGYSILPIIKSRHPLWDQADLETGNEKLKALLQDLARWPANWRATLVTSVMDARPIEIFRVAGPSIWPFLAAIWLVTIFASEIFLIRWLAILGIIGLVASLVGWHWPTDTDTSKEEEEAFAAKHGIPVSIHGSMVVARGGTLLLILLLAIALGSFLFTYFYIRLVNPEWPPAGVPLPGLTLPLLGTIPILLAVPAIRWATNEIKNGHLGKLRWGLLVTLILHVLGLVALALALGSSGFDWRLNGYASAYFALGAYLMLLVLIGVGMNLFALFWAWRNRYSSAHHIAVTNLHTYTHALSLAWMIVIGVVFLSPHGS